MIWCFDASIKDFFPAAKFPQRIKTTHVDFSEMSSITRSVKISQPFPW